MKKISVFYAIYLVCVSLPLIFCSCGEDRTAEYEDQTATTHWMVKSMQDNYLWGDSIKTQKLGWKDYFLRPSQFLSKLTNMASVSDSWSWCSIDTIEENHYQRGQFNYLDSYGIDFTVMTDPTGATSRQFARVITVYPNSPAESCGLLRGDFIGSIDGNRFTSSLSSSLISGPQHLLSVSKLGVNTEDATYLWMSTDTLKIEKSQQVDDIPFPITNSWIYNNHKISYLFVSHLGNDDVENETNLSESLRLEMEKFRTFSPDVFILDLRLCNHGTLELAKRLTSYLSPQGSDFSIFSKIIYGNNHAEKIILHSIDKTLCLNSIQYLYVITSPYTTGVGEWLIHSLQAMSLARPIYTYGRKTAGQNVLLGNIPSDYHVTLHPAVAYVADATGNYDYSEGIQPTTLIDESNYVDLYPYGDMREIILSTILQNLP